MAQYPLHVPTSPQQVRTSLLPGGNVPASHSAPPSTWMTSGPASQPVVRPKAALPPVLAPAAPPLPPATPAAPPELASAPLSGFVVGVSDVDSPEHADHEAIALNATGRSLDRRIRKRPFAADGVPHAPPLRKRGLVFSITVELWARSASESQNTNALAIIPQRSSPSTAAACVPPASTPSSARRG